MKRVEYQQPSAEIIEMEIEDAILQGSPVVSNGNVDDFSERQSIDFN